MDALRVAAEAAVNAALEAVSLPGAAGASKGKRRAADGHTRRKKKSKSRSGRGTEGIARNKDISRGGAVPPTAASSSF